METGRYFATEEAERAAIGRAVGRLATARKHLAALEMEMAELGREWIAFGEALKRPGGYSFCVTEKAITLGKPNIELDRPLGRVTQEHLNWEDFSRLLLDYQKTVREKAELTGKLHDAGLIWGG